MKKKNSEHPVIASFLSNGFANRSRSPSSPANPFSNKKFMQKPSTYKLDYIADKSGTSGASSTTSLGLRAPPRGGSYAGASAPKRGKGVLNAPNAARVPLCAHCNGQIR